MPRPDRVETTMAEGVGLAAEGEAGQEPPNALVHAEDGEDIDRTARPRPRRRRRRREAPGGVDEAARRE
jgi:hypothetical protein